MMKDEDLRGELVRLREMIRSIVEKPARDLTVADVARTMRVSRTKVFAWLKSGQLRAANVGRGSRPVYRIKPDELDRLRGLLGVEPVRAVKRRAVTRPGVTQYF